MKKVLQFLAVSLFFIGFPLGSWYYLNKGYEYRVAMLTALKEDLGRFPQFEFQNQEAKTITNKTMKGKVIIANFADLNTIDQHKASLETLYKIQDQFSKKDDILFYTFIKADTLESVKSYYNTLTVKAEKQWYFLTGAESEMHNFVKEFPFPSAAAKTYKDNSVVAIADTSAIIRHFYNVTKEEDVKKLIAHIATLMPQAEPAKARTKRELEK